MKTYVIEVPEGFEAVETTVDGVTNISFIPKVLGKKLPTTLEETIPFIPERCYYIDIDGDIKSSASDQDLMEANILTSEEYAEAFLALMQLIRFRDIWNEGWIPDWKSSVGKFIIMYYNDAVELVINTYEQRSLYFKTRELRDEFFKEFKDLIETAKPLI